MPLAHPASQPSHAPSSRALTISPPDWGRLVATAHFSARHPKGSLGPVPSPGQQMKMQSVALTEMFCFFFFTIIKVRDVSRLSVLASFVQLPKLHFSPAVSHPLSLIALKVKNNKAQVTLTLLAPWRSPLLFLRSFCLIIVSVLRICKHLLWVKMIGFRGLER